MDIFIIKINENVDDNIIEPFQKKEISNWSKRRQHCIAYYAVDRILETVYNVPNREIGYEGNKPYLKSGEKFFSISHSGEFIAIIFSDSNCGIDIEEIKERDFKEIAMRMNFQNCETLEDFYKVWTAYEAKYKLGSDICAYVSFKNENYQVCAACENIEEPYQIYLKNITDFSNSSD